MSTANEGSDAKFGEPWAVVADGGPGPSLDSFQQAALGNINTLFHRIDRNALERAVYALAGARSVLVVGMHSTHAFATHLHHVAALRFENWHLVEWHSAGPSRIWGALVKQDVVVGIAAEPYENEDFEIARYARSLGARVIGISDGADSPLADCADDILLFPARSPGACQSYVGVATLVEVLVGMVAACDNGRDGGQELCGRLAREGRPPARQPTRMRPARAPERAAGSFS